jgi:hypothetical protein
LDVTIHVGLHKTATTFLQESFFTRIEDALFVHAPHHPPSDPNPVQRFVRDLLFRNPAVLDVQRVRADVSAFLAGQERVIISSEALFGWPFENHVNFRTNADVLAEVFDAPKIWLVIRRQDTWLESAYSQVLKQGLSTSAERFANYRNGEFADFNWNIYNGPNLDVRDLDWGAYVRHYQRRFGADRVLVQPFEEFVADRAAFLRRFCEFAGITPFVPESDARVNIALSPLSALTARVLNKIPMSVKLAAKRRIPPALHPAAILNRTLDPLLPRWRLMPREVTAAALELHREHNRELARLIGQDLGQYGYF